MKRSRKFNLDRMMALKWMFAAMAVSVVARSIYLQTSTDDRLEKLSRRQFESKVTVFPRRGLILDRNGENLAISLKVRSLFMRPRILKRETPVNERARIISNLAKILDTPQKQIAEKFHSGHGFVWLKRQLSEDEERRLGEMGLLDYGDGLALVEETRRQYPNRELASHVLGSVSIDGNGLEGLELEYESTLAGQSSRIASAKDAMGRRIFEDNDGLVALKDGQSLLLTLDKTIQYETEKNLKHAVEEFDARAGSAIVADVQTGEILAMANFPTFNPNQTHGVPADHRRNRAITDTYEPGSTFKPLLIGMALEKGKTPKSRIYCEKGSFKVGGHKISEAEAKEKFEWLTLGEILKFSSNVGAAKLALELGPTTVGQLMDKLGAGSKTGIDLPGEVSGMASRKELKNIVRLANVGFGHGITVTPLQMLTWYLSLANGGTWVQPKFVKAVIAENPESLEKGELRWRLGHEPRQSNARSMYSQTIAHDISKMLESVVEEGGTGVKAQLDEWPVAGKTGTAQKIDPATHRYSRSKYIATFAGFAPAKNPHLVSIVMIDEPKHKYYASETAAPAFREIMRSALLREGIPAQSMPQTISKLATQTTVHSMRAEAEARAEKKQELAALERSAETANVSSGSQVRLPDLKGMSVREALRTLGSEQLNVEVLGSGILKEQHPAAHEWVGAGSNVRLIFSNED